MLKRIINILLLLACISVLEAHPIHVSVTNIELNNNQLDISIRTFWDDWELAYLHETGKQCSMLDMNNETEEWFSNYLRNSFQLRLDSGSSPLLLIIDSVYSEGPAMLIEMHVEFQRTTKSLYLYNAILTSIYVDQTNLLIFSLNRKETGIKFDYRKRNEKISLR